MQTAMKHARAKNTVHLTDGGNPALNFINTEKRNNKGQHIDLLTNYSTFLNWCNDTGLIDWDTWLELDLEKHCYVKEAEGIYYRVRSVRNCLAELFNNLVAGEYLHPHLIERFNDLANEIRAQLSYAPGKLGLQLYWRNTTEEMNLPLWLLIASAVKLVESADVRKIKKCPICRSLFLDQSRRQNRTWCNPQTCGSIRRSEVYFEKKYVRNVKSNRKNLINR